MSKTVYDMAMGTSQMLTCMEERIEADECRDCRRYLYSVRSLIPLHSRIAKADMLIRGGDPNNMQFGDTLSDDQVQRI